MKKLKIKGSVKGVFPDTVFIIFAISALIAVPVRVYQLGTIIDTSSGFFTDKANLTIPLLYAIVSAAAVVILILSFLCGHIPECKAPATPSKPIAICSFITAVGFMISFVQTALGLLSGDEIQGMLTTSTGTIPSVLQAVFALLSCAYFILHGISYLKCDILYRKAGVLACCVPLWFMCRLIKIFTRAISFVNVSEVFFEMLTIVFFVIFFIVFARTVTKVESDGKLWILLSCGFAGSLFAFVCTIPKIAVKLIGGELVDGSPLCLADFALAVFAICYVITIFNKNNNPEKQPIEAPNSDEPQPEGPTSAENVTEVREANERNTVEQAQKQTRDELAFQIAAEYSTGKIDELAEKYNEDK